MTGSFLTRPRVDSLGASARKEHGDGVPHHELLGVRPGLPCMHRRGERLRRARYGALRSVRRTLQAHRSELRSPPHMRQLRCVRVRTLRMMGEISREWHTPRFESACAHGLGYGFAFAHPFQVCCPSRPAGTDSMPSEAADWIPQCSMSQARSRVAGSRPVPPERVSTREWASVRATLTR